MADMRKDVENRIISKAQQDEGFRKRLLSDPKGAIRSMGLQVNDATEWTVVEESGKKLYLVLPRHDAPVQKGGELSDDALAQVAGGGSGGSAPVFNAGCGGCGMG